MRHYLAVAVLLLLCLALLSGSAFARDWFVATSGNDSTGDGTIGNPYATLGVAFDAAQPGDTVQLRAGSYAGMWREYKNGTPSALHHHPRLRRRLDRDAGGRDDRRLLLPQFRGARLLRRWTRTASTSWATKSAGRPTTSPTTSSSSAAAFTSRTPTGSQRGRLGDRSSAPRTSICCSRIVRTTWKTEPTPLPASRWTGCG